MANLPPALRVGPDLFFVLPHLHSRFAAPWRGRCCPACLKPRAALSVLLNMPRPWLIPPKEYPRPVLWQPVLSMVGPILITHRGHVEYAARVFACGINRLDPCCPLVFGLGHLFVGRVCGARPTLRPGKHPSPILGRHRPPQGQDHPEFVVLRRVTPRGVQDTRPTSPSRSGILDRCFPVVIVKNQTTQRPHPRRAPRFPCYVLGWAPRWHILFTVAHSEGSECIYKPAPRCTALVDLAVKRICKGHNGPEVRGLIH